MKYSITAKFIALILCACSLVAMAFSGIGIAFIQGYDLYRTPLETVKEKGYSGEADALAWETAQWYAAKSLSNAPAELLGDIYQMSAQEWKYSRCIVQIWEKGKLIHTEGALDGDVRMEYVTHIRPTYPVVTGTYYVGSDGSLKEAAEEIAVADNAKSTIATDAALARVKDQEMVYSEQHFRNTWNEEKGIVYETVYDLEYYYAPEYEVRVKLGSDELLGPDYMLITVLYPYRDYFIPAVLGALAMFAVSFVFLCSVAGRNQQKEVKLAAINRIPLDLYGICIASLVALQFYPVIWLFEEATYYNHGARTIWDNPYLCLLICCLSGFGIALCVIGYLYAFAAQVKASDNYWLRHTALGWCFRQLGKVFAWIGKGLRRVTRGMTALGRGIRAVFLMLPVIWQWIATAAAMVLVPALFLVLALAARHTGAEVFWSMLCMLAIMGDIVLVLYGGWCFGTLLKGIQTMSKGNLDHKIDTKHLYGSFEEFGGGLNSLAEAAKLAAEQQTKSERMKTELITNVSHDIKTPLTSIINYVDLMKKPHSEQEGEQYLEVLDRQSQRLKKLIDDLMEMSKASSGNVAVELMEVDAVETVNQALGEFADKLDRVPLIPVFRHPDHPVIIRADGKLVWRVLSNVLNNAVKYALPDTRLYVDLMEVQGSAVIAVKNISREQLNVDAEELMERFVRGDASRNTEGSGLGLNIAKSLVEIQNGQMSLMVDGDLFKVTIMFPCA